MSVLEGLFPEVGAGGFTRMEARIQFYSRVRALLEPDHHVLEFGAGRGKFHYLESDPIKRITDISRIPARYALFDVDPVVLENPTSEDRHVAAVGEHLPFEDDSFDIVVAWMVLEHITAPDFYARELGRVLKPGGWLCAVTPNKWGYFSVGARVIPERLHGTFSGGWCRIRRPRMASRQSTSSTRWRRWNDISRHLTSLTTATTTIPGRDISEGR